jgi:hypothetical protein
VDIAGPEFKVERRDSLGQAAKDHTREMMGETVSEGNESSL